MMAALLLVMGGAGGASGAGRARAGAQALAAAPRFPVVWHVGSGYNSVNGSIPAPGWSRRGWCCHLLTPSLVDTDSEGRVEGSRGPPRGGVVQAL